MAEEKWLSWAREIQAIAQSGLAFSKDVYDIERYEQLRRLSVGILSEYTNTEFRKVEELFANETGYATPKIDVRGVVFHEGKLLMALEKADGFWTIPGGFADVGDSPGETAIKEVLEETGYRVEPVKMLAVFDYLKHPHPPMASHVYKLFIQCRLVGGIATSGTETSDVGWFGPDELPPLSPSRNTEHQIRLMFEHHANPARMTDFD